MNASDLYKAGRLKEAIDAQVQEVRSNPADPNRRLFLFELLAFSGDLDRARRQLDAVKYDDADLDPALAQYRKLLEAEQVRRRLFSDGLKPAFLADPPEHVGHRLEAINCLRSGRPGEAAELLHRANADCGEFRGLLNDKSFECLRDTDDLFGTVLEVLAQGRYFWVPIEQIETLALNPPRAPRDQLWAPARMEMNGAMGEVFLAVLYPGSHESPDDGLKLGRATDWKQAEGGPVLGVGLRTFLAGDDVSPLLEWRQLEVIG
jgi:type VI secretion system protein ImpE